jgi:hypothetical protein
MQTIFEIFFIEFAVIELVNMSRVSSRFVQSIFVICEAASYSLWMVEKLNISKNGELSSLWGPTMWALI